MEKETEEKRLERLRKEIKERKNEINKIIEKGIKNNNTTTIRISQVVKEKLDNTRGRASCNKFVDYLLDFFLNK